MNGNFTPFDDGAHSDDDPDANGLDPELLQLFETTASHEIAAPRIAAAAPGVAAPDTTTSEIFVNSVMLKIQQARRHRLIGQAAGIVAIMTMSACLAPYVAQQTLIVAGWFTDRLPATGNAFVSPIGYLCASLIAWRIARWARAY